jgi:hypothetical protein
MSTLARPISNATTDRPSRAWRRIPVSVLIFAAILVLLFVDNVLSYCHEQQVIQMVERFAGKVTKETVGPDWLRELVGKDRLGKMKVFDRIDVIKLNFSEITDGEANQLSRLTNLTSLSIDGTDVTDAGLAHLSRLSSLKVLSLESTAITDNGLTHLSRLANLKDLSLRHTAATATGAEKLRKALPQCRIDGRMASEKPFRVVRRDFW